MHPLVKTELDTTVMSQPPVHSTHSLRHIRLSRCTALLIYRTTSHAHSRQRFLTVSGPITLSLVEEAFSYDSFFWDRDMQQRLVSPAKMRTLTATLKLESARSRASESFTHLGAGQSISLDDLLDVLLLFTLQDEQKVLQLWHGEGMPLEGKEQENCQSM